MIPHADPVSERRIERLITGLLYGGVTLGCVLVVAGVWYLTPGTPAARVFPIAGPAKAQAQPDLGPIPSALWDPERADKLIERKGPPIK